MVTDAQPLSFSILHEHYSISSKVYQKWMQDIDDKGFIPEEELIKSLWPDKIQPKTMNPEFEIKDGSVKISSPTLGASIGYKEKSDEIPARGWNIYK